MNATDKVRDFTNQVNRFFEWVEGKGIDLSNYDFTFDFHLVDQKDSSFKVRAKEIKEKYNHKFNKNERNN